MSKKNKFLNKEKAVKSIVEFIDNASKIFKNDKAVANKIVKKARRVAMKNRVKLPSDVKRRICKHCKSLLVQGDNCRVRLNAGNLIYYCKECKRYTKFRYTVNLQQCPMVRMRGVRHESAWEDSGP